MFACLPFPLATRLCATACQLHSLCNSTHSTPHAWQAGALGQLGNSLNSNQVAPVPVSGGHAFSAISSGGTHTCAIKLDSTTYCWGSSPANGLSQGVNVPRQVAGGHAFAALSTGTCGLESSGSMWCFGEDPQQLVEHAIHLILFNSPAAPCCFT